MRRCEQCATRNQKGTSEALSSVPEGGNASQNHETRTMLATTTVWAEEDDKVLYLNDQHGWLKTVVYGRNADGTYKLWSIDKLNLGWEKGVKPNESRTLPDMASSKNIEEKKVGASGVVRNGARV